MSNFLQGFRDFFESNLQQINSRVSGVAELNRLQERHHLFAVIVNHSEAISMMSGHDFPSEFRSTTVDEISKQSVHLDSSKDTVLILSFPKRWESKLGKQNISGLLGEMAKESQINNYIWGTYSLWNPRTEDQDTGNFYRNSRFHAHDGMLERWIEKHPIPERIQTAIPLDRAPRVMGHSLLTQGRHSFHGYAADQSSGIN